MGLVFRLIELLIVVVPLIGVILAGRKAWAGARRRDAQPAPTHVTADRVEANSAVRWQAIARAVKEQDRIDVRWLDYEIDVGKLLDFPTLTDLRDPLIADFHRAKVRADLLRPTRAEDLLDDERATADYLRAVEELVTTFDVAEAEAIRRRRTGFTADQAARLTRAQHLLRVASDEAATAPERQRAHAAALGELDGLLVLPERARAALQRGIAGELGA